MKKIATGSFLCGCQNQISSDDVIMSKIKLKNTSITMKNNNTSKLWLIIGALILIILLILWLTEAISIGDTDVNAPDAIAYFSNIA